MIVAHRGASGLAPENTMPSFELAWELGADAIEADFHLTLDGHIVCIHDPDTERVADCKMVVRESKLSELQSLDVGLKFDKKFKGTKIPTFIEVLSTIPNGKLFYIEIKCGPEIIPKLVEILKNSEIRKEQVVIISFNKDVLHKIKSEAPEYKVCLLRSFRKNEYAQIIPSIEEVLDTLELIKADGINSNTAIPKDFVKVIKEKGYEWNVWTVDDPETAQRMRTLGAGSITTNLPGYIKKTVN